MMLSEPKLRILVILLSAASLQLASGCRTVEPVSVPGVLEPSNYRKWQPFLATLPTADIGRDAITVHNIRNCSYITEHDYVVHHYDKTFDLDDVRTVDYVVVPFKSAPSVAHTMLSFGFENGTYLAVSAEVRLEEGESYNPLLGILRQYEIMYVVADERDVIRLRTRHRDAEVYVYRTKATPEQARVLLVDVMQRVNKLAREPEFYDTISNNCTSNLVAHVNRIIPRRVPYTVDILLPGLSDRYAYELGLLETDLPFEATKRRAFINELAELHYDAPDFSQKIRR